MIALRLFLCDDNAEYRLLLRLVLEQSGHEIVGEAGDGAEAIARAPTCAAAHVLLLDLNMPNVSGLEALPRLRAALGDGTAIVILTTSHAPSEERQCLDAGADGVIVKPDSVFAFEAEIEAALRRRKDSGRLGQ